MGITDRPRHRPSPVPGTKGRPLRRPSGGHRSHAMIWALVEKADATLTSWQLLHKLRCSTIRITSLAHAVLTLHLAGSERGWKRLND